MKQFLQCQLFIFLSLLISGFAIEVQREDYLAPAFQSQRQRVAEQPALYPEVQYKYALFQNFLDYYIDRPLFFDRSLRPDNFAYLTSESYFRDIAIMRRYGFTGSGSLALGIFNLYKQVNSYLDADPVRAAGHQEYVQFGFGEMGRFSADNKQLLTAKEILKIATASPYAGRINGKIFISTYNSGHIPLDTMRQFLAALREDFPDTLLIAGGLVIDHVDNRYFRDHGHWTEEIQEKYRSRMTDVLSLFDGVQLPVGFRRHRTQYTTELDFGVYEKYLLPMALEITSQEPYRQKLLGAVVNHAYINHFTGVNFGEYGTATIRKNLDHLLKVNPDFIVFFEWNEFNENTCFQPTIANSLALQRLIKYYSNVIMSKQPTPEPDDDLQLPPLVLSHRETLKVGEVLEFELLNIPDRAEQTTYTTQLRLLDINGQEVVSFPQETFEVSQLRAITYRIGTEQLTPRVILQPELTVNKFDGQQEVYKNLQYVRLLPTFCYNYKTIRQPIRDLLQPETVNFTVTRNPDGSDKLTGAIKVDEPLAAVEVTDYGKEFFAVDPSQEFDPENNWLLIGTLSTRQSGSHQFELTVLNSPDWQFHPWWRPNIKFGNWQMEDGVVKSRSYIWAAANSFIVSVPRAASSAIIKCTLDEEVQLLPLADFLRLGAWSWQFSDCRLDWKLCQQLPDLAPCIDEPEASFAVNLTSSHRHPIYQLRAVTRSGRIFRSQAIMPMAPPSDLMAIPVHTELSDQVQTVSVLSAFVPDLKYQIHPFTFGGAVLTNSFDPYFNGKLGGGYVYAEAFHRFPLPEGRQIPEYVVDDGQPALRFDGGSYITMPNESFPRGSFTLQFAVKPDQGEETYVLFRHFENILGSVTIFVEDDQLKLAFGDREEVKAHSFPSNLQIPREQWSSISISYDFSSFRFQVNDQVSVVPVPRRLLALYFKPAIFGGHTKVEFGLPAGAHYYSGLMRDIAIRHW